MFHLYRIYNLRPVIHENLRPEKPPKPFPRAGDADADGEDAVTPRKRSKRAKRKPEDEALGAYQPSSWPRSFGYNH